MKEPTSFEAFWPNYLAAHSDRRSRALHVVGTATALLCAAAFLVTWNGLWALAALVAGYGAAWTGHLLFERNVPKTFSHPIWSIRGDLTMLGLALLGRLEREVNLVREAELAKPPSERRSPD